MASSNVLIRCVLVEKWDCVQAQTRKAILVSTVSTVTTILQCMVKVRIFPSAKKETNFISMANKDTLQTIK